ncbi:MAG: phage tail protein [Thermoanaerobaculia bacterium]|nr:phage tail protein [Thermoanaerobaculia bacterium]
MPQTGDGIWESYRTDEFVLVVGQNPSPGVTKVSPLDLGEIETIEQPDGGSGKIYKIAGQKLKFKPLTVERYVDGSPEDKVFMDWFKETFNLSAGTQGGSSARRSGQIIKLHNGQPVLTFAFYNAWVKSTTFSDLEAGSTGHFKQTIVLEHEGLELIESA